MLKLWVDPQAVEGETIEQKIQTSASIEEEMAVNLEKDSEDLERFSEANSVIEFRYDLLNPFEVLEWSELIVSLYITIVASLNRAEMIACLIIAWRSRSRSSNDIHWRAFLW